MSTPDLTFLLDHIAGSTALPGEAETETTLIRKEERSACWADKKPVLQEAGMTDGCCLRVLEKGGQGIITARAVDPSFASELSARALEMARISSPDPHRRMAKPAQSYPRQPRTDDSLFARSSKDIFAELSRLEQKILRTDPRVKKTIKLQYTESRSETALANSRSVRLVKSFSSASFSVEVLAEEGGDTEVAWDLQSRRFAGDLSLDEAAESTAIQAAQSLGGKQLPSGSYPVVLHPRVGAQLLGLLRNALSAEAVQLGRSFFQGKIRRQVASPPVTLIDDPLLPEGLASASHDDEGTPHQTCVMVQEGMLNDYFYDLRCASKEARVSNGHGLKESLGAPPRPGSTNFYMKAGSVRLPDMLASHKKVFYLREVMGLHMADPITGEFSLGASGFLYENGRHSHPVRGVTIAGNLTSFLKDISSVGDDLTWYGSTGVPSLLLSQVMIAGS